MTKGCLLWNRTEGSIQMRRCANVSSAKTEISIVLPSHPYLTQRDLLVVMWVTNGRQKPIQSNFGLHLHNMLHGTSLLLPNVWSVVSTVNPLHSVQQHETRGENVAWYLSPACFSNKESNICRNLSAGHDEDSRIVQRVRRKGQSISTLQRHLGRKWVPDENMLAWLTWSSAAQAK